MSSSSPFQVFREAVRVVDRNVPALLIYWGVILPVVVFHIGMDSAGDTTDLALSTWRDMASLLGFTVLDAVANALAATLAFSRIGRGADKPLWKIDSDWTALQRFFPMWLFLSLLLGAVSLLTAFLTALSEDGSVGLFMVLLYIVCASATVPVGACLMFGGRVAWRNIPEMLQPMANQLGGVSFFIAFGVLAYFFLLDLLARIPPEWAYAKVVVHIIGGYCDCIVFAGTWLLYRADRDTPRNEDDFIF